MATRKALVIVAGQIQQLQSGDTLSGLTSTGVLVTQTNDEAGAIVIGAPVYSDAADGVKKAQANASTASKVIGLVNDTSISNGVSGQVILSGILVGTTGQWDAVAGTTGGLSFGTRYYLSAATAGLLTSTAPSTVGQYVVEVGIAISTTEMLIVIKPSILL